MEYFVLVLIDVLFIMRIIKMMNNNEMRCHRMPERCLKIIRDKHWRICTRCLFMNIGIVLYPLVFYIVKTNNVSLMILIVACIGLQLPMLVDGITQSRKLRESNNILRAVSGFGSGLGLSLGICFMLLIGGY